MLPLAFEKEKIGTVGFQKCLVHLHNKYDDFMENKTGRGKDHRCDLGSRTVIYCSFKV
jgi:hypothetical protein